MIQTQTQIKIADNSGVRLVKCFKVYTYNYGFIGTIVLVSVKETKNQSQIKKGDIYKTIVVRVKKKFLRKSGWSITFNQNAAVLLNKKNEFLATRCFGPIGNELRKKSFLKLLSLASAVI
jgi:large subunit ribosomal protein L14